MLANKSILSAAQEKHYHSPNASAKVAQKNWPPT
jgi:hypothetical protein